MLLIDVYVTANVGNPAITSLDNNNVKAISKQFIVID